MKIFLLGMMGSGKSYWMKRLSSALQIPGYDLDAVIETAEGQSISKIFETKGESHFRTAEAAALRSFESSGNAVIATGGGTPCFHGNMQWMNQHGITIFLDEDIQKLAAQLQPEKAHRPLIAALSDDELTKFLLQKREERSPYYAAAQHTLSGIGISEANLLAIIQKQTSCTDDISAPQPY